MPLSVVSEVGGGLNGGSPWEVCPVIVNTWRPQLSQENATSDAAMTTRALRTEPDRKEEKGLKPLTVSVTQDKLHDF